MILNGHLMAFESYLTTTTGFSNNYSKGYVVYYTCRNKNKHREVKIL